jgi:hypothetical protein
MKRYALCFLGALTLSLFVASHARSASSWSGPVLVTQIEVSDTGAGAKTYLLFNQAPIVTGCSNPSNGQWLVSGSTDNIKNITSLATSSKLGARTVTVFWNNGCSGGGTTGYPVLTGLTLN